ncbi:MAG: hemerythrin domain-containing protein [Pseudomonadota bacterium]
MTIFERLRADHAVQRELATKLLATHGDSDDRARLFGELKLEMLAHEKAEERYFYVPLIECDLTQERARHSIAEHHELDEFIEQLEETEFSSPGWLKIATHMVERLRHHLNEEEHEIFQLAGKALNQKSKRTLATEYVHLMEDERA